MAVVSASYLNLVEPLLYVSNHIYQLLSSILFRKVVDKRFHKAHEICSYIFFQGVKLGCSDELQYRWQHVSFHRLFIGLVFTIVIT